MTLNIAADGSYTSTQVDSNGKTGTSRGKFSITSVGNITDLRDEPTLLCNMDAGKTVFACTDTPKSGITELGVFTKQNQNTSYALTDLEGTWNGNFVTAGAGTNWWTRMAINIDSNGSVTGGTSVDSAGNTGTPSGNFSITPDGILTWSAEPNMLCSMDAGKTIIACTDSPDSDSVDMAVFTNTGPSYTAADLAGTWSVKSMATGPSAPDWLRITLTVKPDGTFSYRETYYDGTTNKKNTKTGSGTLQITSDGLTINVGKDANILCKMDANETVMSCTETWDNDGSTELVVLTRNLK